jgi:hypothetical protein
MGLVAGRDGAADGYEPMRVPSGQRTGAPGAATMFRRQSAQPSRRAVLHLRTSQDAPVPPELASWFTERGFHFYVAGLRIPGGGGQGRGWWRAAAAELPAAFSGLDAQRDQMRTADGIDQVMVTAHGDGALAAALWCAGRRGPGRSRADALILYAPEFGRALRRGLDIPCPVLVIGGPVGRAPDGSAASGERSARGSSGRDGVAGRGATARGKGPARGSSGTGGATGRGAAAARRGAALGGEVLGHAVALGGAALGLPGAGRPPLGRPAAAGQLGRHVTWLRPTDGRVGPDAPDAADRSWFFDELGRWLGAYMYGDVRDRLL